MSEENWIEQGKAPFWKPSTMDEELIGIVKAIEEVDEKGKNYVIARSDDDEIKTPSNIVLQSKMSRVKVGDKVKIIYKGESEKSTKGNKAKLYDVFIDKGDE